jgi:DNA-binding CsgD family transcriptional regulator
MDITDDGRVLVANNDGLLIFNGYKWDLYPLPNRTIARSVEYHRDTIYVGGQDEIGYFAKDSIGKLRYHSLWEMIPDSFDIADVWDIKWFENRLFFRTSRRVFVLEKDGFVPVANSLGAELLVTNGDDLVFNDISQGLLSNNSGKYIIEKGSTALNHYVVVDVISHEDGLLVFTEGMGIFLLKEDGALQNWETNAQSYVVENKINKALRLKAGGLAIGTKYGGVVLLGQNGQTRYRLDRSNGLQDNNITDLHEDEAHNVWVTSFYGVDRIGLGSGLFSFSADGDFQGAVYDVVLWRNKWWFATNNGLFTIPFETYSDPFEDPQPKLFPGTSGQAWGLDIIDDQLYLAHHKGAFLINNALELKHLGVTEGVWKFVDLNDGRLAIGCYEGVYILEKSYSEAKKLKGFSESSRIMMVDNEGSLWISHPYRGVFRLQLGSELEATEIKRFSAGSGFECDLGNYVFSVDQTPVLTNECGVFRYDILNESFVPFDMLGTKIDSSDQVRRIFETEEGFWIITEEETCLVEMVDEDPPQTTKTCIAHIGKEYVGGFENLFVVDSSNVVLCADRGIRLYHRDEDIETISPRTIISEFKVNEVSRITLNDQTSEHMVLEPWENDISLEFRAIAFVRKDLQGFQYRMQGVSDEWTTSVLPFAGFSNLDPGEYKFTVQAITKDGRISAPVDLTFEIRQWWYRTIWAQTGFAFGIIAIFFLTWLMQRRIYERDTTSLIKEKEKTEDELEQVKAERLMDELRFKNKELTSATLHLMQKQQTLSAVRTKIEDLEKKIDRPVLKKEIRRLYSLLNSSDRLEDDWEKFGLLFDQVHVDFLTRLKKMYPNLKPKDRKLCAFLRMNLTTKEIAPLLNISVRGVEISRYRLRKKLDLPTEVNLTEFISSL